MYSLPNAHIDVSPVASPKKLAVRPSRKENSPPPLSFTNSPFGKTYLKNPDFERKLLEAQKIPITLDSKLNTKEEGKPTLYSNSKPAEAKGLTRSSSVRTPPTPQWDALPLEDLVFWQTRGLPKAGPQKEMVQKMSNGIERSPFGWIICHDVEPDDFARIGGIPRFKRRSSWEQINDEDEMALMNSALDYMLES
ncbi:hypothetical protein AAFC00_001533 [Neodothiora populina]|uniref:Uncharacterized protein n=1 Tax=Neodothiora populina TaxID=2781224 RepID=A0ABR3PP83_9PEZI